MKIQIQRVKHVVDLCAAPGSWSQDHNVEFVDGRTGKFDAIILATRYRSNVSAWLKICYNLSVFDRCVIRLINKLYRKALDTNLFSKEDRFPTKSFLEGWKGDCGLYTIAFTRRGLLGIVKDLKCLKMSNSLEAYEKKQVEPSI
ncbi:flavin-binding monooxygenase family protein [Artemisia annua]|uniref:Flavin-binding monooxygenase family protein n=1 Tax=Artemisia annua TaxID=35608 RepID=A0A2U1NYQ7_ARTAN|nr:flavin-binding monooxygenase family protein [Artemisia annua]